MRGFIPVLVFGMMMGFIAQERPATQGVPLSLFEALVYDSIPDDPQKAYEI